jgi:hypothetical protein
MWASESMEAPARLRSIGAYSCGILILAIGVGDHLFSEGGAHVAECSVQPLTILPKHEFRTLEKSANMRFQPTTCLIAPFAEIEVLSDDRTFDTSQQAFLG